MKNIFLKVIGLILIFMMVFPHSFIFAGSVESTTDDVDLDSDNASPTTTDTSVEEAVKKLNEAKKEDFRTKNIFEQVCTEFFLSVGDYAHDFLSQTLREEITIDKIIYNKSVMLNANFFENAENPANSDASKIIREFINDWYSYLRKLTLVVIMICIVVAGIKIILGTPDGKVKAQDILKNVVMAVALIFFFPYVMKYAFDINEAIVNQIYTETHVVDKALGASISQISDLLIDELEFRSPQYISGTALKVGAGSTEATLLYLSKVEQYKASADIMRIMRAFAGVTLRFMYVIIWYILLVQTYILTISYIKRYIVIAFLITIYPLVVIGYVIGGMTGKSKLAFNSWCSKYFTNVFIQSIHAIIYGVVTGVMVDQIRNAMVENGTKLVSINWILMVVVVSFLFSAEKILTKLWHAAIDTSERGGIKNFLNAPKDLWKRMKG